MRALIDHHLHLDSWVHRWHPGCKWVAFGVLALATVSSQKLSVAGLSLCLGVVTVGVARLPWRIVATRLAPLALVLGAFVAIAPWLGGGEYVDGGWAGLIALKCLAVVVWATVLMATTSTARLLAALSGLGVPRRVVELFGLTFRFAFATAEEFAALRRAAVCRGYQMGIGWGDLRTLGRLSGALLLRGMGRADRIYVAMLARGYDGTIWSRGDRSATWIDYVKLGLASGLAGLIFVARWF